jgi:hypothetical protein
LGASDATRVDGASTVVEYKAILAAVTVGHQHFARCEQHRSVCHGIGAEYVTQLHIQRTF